MLRLILAALLALSVPADADANVPVAWQRKALTTAQRVWQPSCGALRIQFAQARDFGGTEQWGGWAYAGECTIYEPAGRSWLGYPEFCTAVLHEAGHAAGRGHSDRGIMNPEQVISRSVNLADGRRVVVWRGVDRRCLTRVQARLSGRG